MVEPFARQKCHLSLGLWASLLLWEVRSKHHLDQRHLFAMRSGALLGYHLLAARAECEALFGSLLTFHWEIVAFSRNRLEAIALNSEVTVIEHLRILELCQLNVQSCTANSTLQRSFAQTP